MFLSLHFVDNLLRFFAWTFKSELAYNKKVISAGMKI